MKLKFETFYRGFMGLCLVLLLWSFYASAQTNVTGVSTNGTNTSATVSGEKAKGDLTEEERKKKEEEEKKKAERQDWITFGLDQYPTLRDTIVLGNPLWKYISSLIYIFLAFYVSKLLDFLVGVWLKKWASRTNTQFDDLLLELVHGPVKIVSFVIFLHVGLSVFEWPAVIEKFLSKGLLIIVAISLTYMVMKLVDLFMGYWREKHKQDADRSFDDQLYPIVRKTLKVFVIVVSVLVTSSNLGVNITAAVASLSIGGLAIGLAAQDTLANLFGAVAVFLDKPFRIGDRIQLDAVDGTVETIGLRSTRVRNLDGFLVTIPNKTMGNATITNVTRRPTIKTSMFIGVTYDTSYAKLQRAVEILKDIYSRNEKTQDLQVSFSRFGPSSLDIQVVHWWGNTEHKEYLAGMHAMNLEVKRRFDEEKIEFAFPTQTVYLRQDSEWKLAANPSDDKGASASPKG